jgi:ribosomal protein S4
MKYPSYMLNPGDMFSVDVDQVLWSLGAPKAPSQTKQSSVEEEDQKQLETGSEEQIAAASESETVANEDDMDADAATKFDAEFEEELNETIAAAAGEESAAVQRRKESLSELRLLIKDILHRANPSPKRKQELRTVHKRIMTTMSSLKKVKEKEITDIEASIGAIMDKIEGSIAEEAQSADGKPDYVSKYRQRRLRREHESNAIQAHLEKLAIIPNPTDPSKPYATPWRPRDYMSPFAFIPRYLEVNHTICSAVYLRHPVARPGQSEVPTPFTLDMGGLAHAWYLRRK